VRKSNTFSFPFPYPATIIAGPIPEDPPANGLYSTSPSDKQSQVVVIVVRNLGVFLQTSSPKRNGIKEKVDSFKKYFL
jgi:hypothetical protein